MQFFEHTSPSWPHNGKVHVLDAKQPSLTQNSRSTVGYWLDRTNCKTIALRLHYAGTPQEFLEKQAQSYLRDTNKNALSKHIKYLTKFQSSFRRYEGEILQLEGVGPGLEKAERMSREVTEVIVWLEELLCQSMVGLLSFQAVYLAKRFMYQNE